MIQRKIAIILYGPPGSGKGTQANLLADQFGLIHFDTGRFFESVVHDPKRQKEKIIKKERKLFDNGILMTPSFVLRETKKEATRIAGAGWGLVFSGSPRTMHEAEHLIPVLESLYGRKNIFFFVLTVPPELSVARNSKRLVCTFCKAPLLTAYYPSSKPKHCPICGAALYRRTLDNEKIIRKRLVEYRERTVPIFIFAKKKGYIVKNIDGRPHPYRVFQAIHRTVARKTGK